LTGSHLWLIVLSTAPLSPFLIPKTKKISQMTLSRQRVSQYLGGDMRHCSSMSSLVHTGDYSRRKRHCGRGFRRTLYSTPYHPPHAGV